MAYARRNRRLPLTCQALLFLDGSNDVIDVADISERGISAVMPVRLAVGTQVGVQLDPQRWPDFPRLQGIVRSVRGRRAGIGFAILVDSVRTRLAELIAEIARQSSRPGHLAGVRPAHAIRPQLAHSQTGRELLYQTAHERLSAGEPARAREALLAALAADPQNREYRVLLHRVEAEEHLAVGAASAAESATARALALAPGDDDVKALVARLPSRARPQRPAAAVIGRVGLLSRLLGRG